MCTRHISLTRLLRIFLVVCATSQGQAALTIDANNLLLVRIVSFQFTTHFYNVDTRLCFDI
jgi:hypothetical protein